MSDPGPPQVTARSYATLTRGLVSLDPAEIVTRGLAVLRHVAGTEDVLLLDAGACDELKPLLAALDDATVRVSRSEIRATLVSRTSRLLVTSELEQAPAVGRLEPSHVWLRPLFNPDGRPLAVVYLESRDAGGPLTPDAIGLLEQVTDDIGTALYNAIVFNRVRQLNLRLEAEVVSRLKELEEGRAKAVAQDRLATLGRLVAAIAHELNNPIGAIASFSRTIRDALKPLLFLRDELDRLLPDVSLRATAWTLLDSALSAASRVPPDTRTRRALESSMEALLSSRGIRHAEPIARRFARMGLTIELLEAAMPALQVEGEAISALADRVHVAARSIETIADCASNVARIVDGLKTYAHLDQSQEEVTDIHRSLSATLTVLAPRVPRDVELRTNFATIAPVAHRPGEMSQVWTNLVDNALRAMGETGTLTVETGEQNGVVRVRFTDSGTGVPPMLQDRIFDLDVTTRGSGAGLGLGLPICRRIVEEHHGGSLAFDSRPGHTVFTVYLPRRGEAPHHQ